MESPANNKNGNKAILIGIGVIVAVCCACALIVAAVGVVAYNRTMQTTLKRSIPISILTPAHRPPCQR